MKVGRLAAVWVLLGVSSVVGCGGNEPTNPYLPLPSGGADAGAGGAGARGSARGVPTTTSSGGTSDGGSTGGSLLDARLADTAVGATFTGIYTGILLVTCSGAACHNPGSAHGINVFTQTNAYSTLRDFVVPGSALDSKLYRVLVSGEMPQGGPRLSPEALASIAAWIDAGALND